VIASATDSRLRAVLGPTNTGKTHLAIERLCGHSSGAIGFPLRLLAREVYDRVRAIKGDNQGGDDHGSGGHGADDGAAGI
jgi:ATP-dependent RNA helicase SUPV3L1/SUV3